MVHLESLTRKEGKNGSYRLVQIQRKESLVSQRADQETNSLLEGYFPFWRPFFFLWQPSWLFWPLPTGKKATLRRGDREIEAPYTPTEFASELRRLAIALGIAVENGEQCNIQIAGEQIAIPAGARFSIEYEREGDEEELELQIKWKSNHDPL